MTGVIIANYNTDEYIEKAVLSVSDCVDKVLIVDQSDSPKFCKGLEWIKNVHSLHIDKNIGHAPALNLGIAYLKPELIIVMDSDAWVKNPSIIDIMKSKLTADVYGVGKVLNPTGFDADYLSPIFAMIPYRMYVKNVPFIHSGAPMGKTMIDIKGKYKVVNIDNFDSMVGHEGRATREIAGNWRKGFFGRDGV